MASFIIDDFTGGASPSNSYGDWTKEYSPGNSSHIFAGWSGQASEADIGLLRRSLGEVSLSNASVPQSAIKWIAQSGDGGNYLYALEDNTGVYQKIHRFNPATNSISNASPWPYSIPSGGWDAGGQGTGLAVFGNALYWASGKNIGSYNFSGTFNNTVNASLGTKAFGGLAYCEHPLEVGNGQIFIGDSDANGNACISTYNGSVFTKAKLDLSKTGQTVKALRFSGNYLYIAASGADYSGALVAQRPSTMYVWDTTSGSWQQQYPFPEIDFRAIHVQGGKVIGIGFKHVYSFNGYGWDVVCPMAIGQGVNFNSADLAADGVLYWLNSSGSMWRIGSKHKKIPVTAGPYADFFGYGSSVPTALKWLSATDCMVGFNSPAGSPAGTLRRFSTAASLFSGNAPWRTPMISASSLGFRGSQAKLVRVIVDLAEALPDGSETQVSWYPGDGRTNVPIGYVKRATSADSSYSRFVLTATDGCVDSDFQLELVHTAGNTPKIHHIIFEAIPEKN